MPPLAALFAKACWSATKRRNRKKCRSTLCRSRSKRGKIPEAEAVSLIESDRFHVLEVRWKEAGRTHRYTQGTRDAIKARYKIVLETSEFTLLIPNVE